MTRPPAVDMIGAFDEVVADVVRRGGTHPSVEPLMYGCSWLGDDGRVWFVAAAVEAARRDRSALRFLHSVVWLGIESAVVNLVLKKLVRRPRPSAFTEHDHAHDLRLPTDTSFPSGHAASAATMSVLLSDDSPLAPLYVALAAGIGTSRVAVGVHHPSDVVAGWAAGALFGLLGRRTSRWLGPTGG